MGLLRLASVGESFNSTRKLKKKSEKSSLKTVNQVCKSLPRWSSGQRRERVIVTDPEGPGSNPLAVNFS